MRVAPFINLLLAVCLLFSCQPGNSQVSANQPPELTPEMQELMKEWKGQAHRFEIDACEVRYNGKPFSLESSYEQIIEVLGQEPDRKKGYWVGWNEIGISISTGNEETRIATIIFSFGETLRDRIDPFKGVILLYGMPLKYDQLWGEYLQSLRDHLGAVYVMENSYEIRTTECGEEEEVCILHSPVHYKTVHAGHLQIAKEYDPSTTYPVDRIFITRDTK